MMTFRIRRAGFKYSRASLNNSEIIPFVQQGPAVVKMDQAVGKTLFFHFATDIKRREMHRFVTQTIGAPVNYHQVPGIQI